MTIVLPKACELGALAYTAAEILNVELQPATGRQALFDEAVCDYQMPGRFMELALRDDRQRRTILAANRGDELIIHYTGGLTRGRRPRETLFVNAHERTLCISYGVGRQGIIGVLDRASSYMLVQTAFPHGEDEPMDGSEPKLVQTTEVKFRCASDVRRPLESFLRKEFPKVD